MSKSTGNAPAGPPSAVVDGMSDKEISLVIRLNKNLLLAAVKSCQLMVKEGDVVTFIPATAAVAVVDDIVEKIKTASVAKPKRQQRTS